MNFTLVSDSQFTLTCISNGGPATTVTWTRDSTTVTEGTETVLANTVTAEYVHTLQVIARQEGVYTCAISNRVSIISAELDVAGENLFWYYFYAFSHHHPAPSSPSDVSVSQNGLSSLLVTWTPSQGPDVTGYTVYYQQQDGGDNSSVEAGQNDTSITIPGLIVGATYSISIVTNSSTLPSTVTTGPSATIGILDHMIHTFPET